MASLAEKLAVASVVLGAALYLVLHWSGAIQRIRSRSKPDVPVSRLVRKKDEHCDRCDS